MNSKRAARVAAVVLVLAVGATGCGGGEADGKAAAPSVAPTASPTERLESATGDVILQKAREDFKKAGSVKLTGFTVEDDTKSTYKVSADRQGNCAGSIVIEGRGSLELVQGKGQTFLKFDEQLLTSVSGPAAAQHKGRWVKIGKDDAFESFAQFCDLGMVPLFGDGSPGEQFTSAGTETIDGRKTVLVDGFSGEGTFTGYVQTEGPALPIRIESLDKNIRTEFSEYGAPVTVTLPPYDQVIDLNVLMK
ncbi:hypothetical protein ACWEQL_08560 [Kitasatospora sp. NPDC004240]